MSNLPRYNKEQVAHIVKSIKDITVQGLPVFNATLVNAMTNEPIGLNQIRSFGMIYIKIESHSSVGNFAILVDPEQETSHDR